MRFLPFISLLFLFGCSEKESINDIPVSVKPSIKLGLKFRDTGYLKSFSSLFSVPKIISLTGNDSSFFLASIQKLIIYKKEFFVLDDRFSNLLRFDSAGRYLNNYGKIGLGTNEYQKIHDFEIDTTNNMVVIFSNSNKSIYYYSLPTGIFIKKVNIKLFGSKIALLSNGETLLYRSFSSEGNKLKQYDYNVLILDSSGNKVRKAFPFNSDISNVEWKGSGFLRQINKKIFYENTFSDTIYQFTDNKFSAYIVTDILSEKLKKEKDDHHKLIGYKIMSDSLTSYLGSYFIANSQFAIFDFVKRRRRNIAVLDLENNTCILMSSQSSADPYISTELYPIYLSENGEAYFKVDRKNIQYLREKKPQLFEKFSKEEKAIFNDSTQKSGVYLIKTQIQPQKIKL